MNKKLFTTIKTNGGGISKPPSVSPKNIVHEFVENSNYRYKIDIQLVIMTK